MQTWNNYGAACRVVQNIELCQNIQRSYHHFHHSFHVYQYLYLRNIPVVDVTHFVPLFSSVHKLVSLKVFLITIEGDEGGLPAVTIPPQHCPSLLVVELEGRASSFLFQSSSLAQYQYSNSTIAVSINWLALISAVSALVLFEYSNTIISDCHCVSLSISTFSSDLFCSRALASSLASCVVKSVYPILTTLRLVV